MVACPPSGLVGKVLVIDEVHSYDTYMSQYLHQLLAWCSDAQIPVVLMSATLPPGQRRDLIAAYARGLADAPPLDLAVDDDGAYPRLTSWTPTAGLVTVSSESARSDLLVHVESMCATPKSSPTLPCTPPPTGVVRSSSSTPCAGPKMSIAPSRQPALQQCCCTVD